MDGGVVQSFSDQDEKLLRLKLQSGAGDASSPSDGPTMDSDDSLRSQLEKC